MKISKEAKPFLKTLRRIPADVRLSMATRELSLGNPHACLVGWALREAIFAQSGIEYGHVGAFFSPPLPGYEYPSHFTSQCVLAFGGTEQEWLSLYYGVVEDAGMPLIEEAFLVAVAEAAEGRRLVA